MLSLISHVNAVLHKRSYYTTNWGGGNVSLMVSKVLLGGKTHERCSVTVTSHCHISKSDIWMTDLMGSWRNVAISRCSLPDLWPRPRPPLGWTRHSVAGPPALWLLAAAVFAVDRAVGAVVEELHAANGPDLKAQAAAGSGAVLPLVRDPPRCIKARRLARIQPRI